MRLTYSLVATAAVLAFSANSALYVPPLEVTQTQIIDNATGKSTNTYQVDGIEIELSKEDKTKARNWNLSNSEWAQYKYAMEYTPRGTWSPNLDPPIVLGNLADTDEERRRYGRLMNELERARQKREINFQLAANSTLSEMNPLLTNASRKQESGLAKDLPGSFDKLRSIFVDINTCDASCKKFITLAVASTSSSTKLDIHATNGNEIDVTNLLSDIGLSLADLQVRQVTINAHRNNPMIERYRDGGKVPFFINRTDQETTRYHNK